MVWVSEVLGVGGADRKAHRDAGNLAHLCKAASAGSRNQDGSQMAVATFSVSRPLKWPQPLRVLPRGPGTIQEGVQSGGQSSELRAEQSGAGRAGDSGVTGMRAARECGSGWLWGVVRVWGQCGGRKGGFNPRSPSVAGEWGICVPWEMGGDQGPGRKAPRV